MPEGDSLNLAAQKLGPALIGKTVRAILLQRRAERTDGIVGKRIEGVEARGKNLLVHFEGGFSLHVHLKMWGQIFLRPLPEARARSSAGFRAESVAGSRAAGSAGSRAAGSAGSRAAGSAGSRAAGSAGSRPAGTGADTVVVLDTDRDRLLVVKAPVARLIRTRDLARDVHFRNLGPDLLAPTFDAAEALRRLASRKGVPLGEALADQSVVAGIGNVWKSELCFNLKLYPFAPVSAFTEDELERLLALARKQMKETVERKPRTIPDPFTPRGSTRQTRQSRRLGQKPVSVYEREGEACYDCGTRIRMRRQGELLRSTDLCPSCQPERGAA